MRTSVLDRHPENKDRVAIMFANGLPYKKIAEEFEVTPDTVGVWKKRPDIQSLVSKFIEQRSNAILSHTDTAILKRLERARDEEKPLPVEVLLRIRQTFAGEKVVVDTGKDKSDAAAELLQAAREDPALAAAVAAMGSGAADDDSE